MPTDLTEQSKFEDFAKLLLKHSITLAITLDHGRLRNLFERFQSVETATDHDTTHHPDIPLQIIAAMLEDALELVAKVRGKDTESVKFIREYYDNVESYSQDAVSHFENHIKVIVDFDERIPLLLQGAKLANAQLQYLNHPSFHDSRREIKGIRDRLSKDLSKFAEEACMFDVVELISFAKLFDYRYRPASGDNKASFKDIYDQKIDDMETNLAKAKKASDMEEDKIRKIRGLPSNSLVMLPTQEVDVVDEDFMLEQDDDGEDPLDFNCEGSGPSEYGSSRETTPEVSSKASHNDDSPLSAHASETTGTLRSNSGTASNGDDEVKESESTAKRQAPDDGTELITKDEHGAKGEKRKRALEGDEVRTD